MLGWNQEYDHRKSHFYANDKILYLTLNDNDEHCKKLKDMA